MTGVSVDDHHAGLAPVGEPAAGIDIFGATDRGKVRSLNEDQFFVATLHKAMRVRQSSLGDLTMFDRLRGSVAHLLVVADGLGGLGGGELASRTAVETLVAHIGETIGCYYSLDVDNEHEFLAQLQGAVERSHQQVLERHAPTAGPGPATTLTMAALLWPRTYIVHVGDSRAYYLRGGQLRQITRDQNAYEDLVDQGMISEEEAQSGGLKRKFQNVLTSALGAEIKPSTGLIDLEVGDVLLLCTDGLTKHVPDDEIAGILSEGHTAEGSCRQLINLTLDRGASDNVTVIVGRFAGGVTS